VCSILAVFDGKAERMVWSAKERCASVGIGAMSWRDALLISSVEINESMYGPGNPSSASMQRDMFSVTHALPNYHAEKRRRISSDQGREEWGADQS
jgi:hypothetical protein